MKSHKKKTRRLNNRVLLLFLFIYPFIICQEIDPWRADKYYFSLLFIPISRIVLTYYSQNDFGPLHSLRFKIEQDFEAHNVSDAAFWGSFNTAVYKKALTEYQSKGLPALLTAIQNEQLGQVHLWLNRGIDPNRSSERCNNHDNFRHCKKCHPMRFAACKGNIPIFLALKRAGGKIDRLTMNDAVEGGSLPMVLTLYNLGCDNNCWLNVRRAINQENMSLVEFLLSNSNFCRTPDPDYYGFSYTTLIIDSIENTKSAAITHILLNACPDYINSVDSWYITGFGRRTERPLNTALRKKKFALAKDMIQKGAWVNPPPLVNSVQSFELNPLWQAAHADNKEAVEFLLQNGANPNHLAGSGKSKDGEPVIEFIEGYIHGPNSAQIVQLLREHASKN